MATSIVIDACSILNLLATRRELEIVRGLEFHLLETPQAGAEAVTLWTPPDADGLRVKEPVSKDSLRKAGRLEMCPLVGDELLDAFVTTATYIEDADASCIALAGIRKLPLLTDDAKERRVAREIFPQIVLVSTLDVLADAESALVWSQDDIRQVARDLRWRGNFAPPRKDPRAKWFEGLLK